MFFSDAAEAANKNPDNEDAELFSILDKLEFFRGIDGKFLFKLCYPEMEGQGVLGGHCNVWYQTSNPFTDSMITGYEKVMLAFGLKSDETEFVGLGRNNKTTSSATKAAISDSPFTDSWWMAVGAFAGESGKIPGPVDQYASIVELFVAKARRDPNIGVGVDGSITVRCNEPGEDLDVGYNLKSVQLTCSQQ